MLHAVRAVLALLVLHLPVASSAIEISNRYRSLRNPERKVRASTELIVLHTTEAPARSSLNKLSDRGEAHFCVTEVGQVYAIVDRDREAFHAGRSMWNGREDVDKFSIGIECVGYHDKPMSSVQLAAIRDLVKELKRMYRIPDERVVCHSHVAYGTPNKWQKRRHRGRKRCGMLFAMPSVRRVLELKSRPAFDADTRAGRLAVGDDYLQKVLYGRTDTMIGKTGGAAPSAAPAAAAASSGGIFSGISRWFGGGGEEKKSAAPKPKAAISAKKPAAPAKPKAKAKVAATAPTAAPTSVAQLKKQGYKLKGTISASTTASKLAGGKWNAADTYYVIRNKVIPGNRIDEAHIEKGMAVWMRH